MNQKVVFGLLTAAALVAVWLVYATGGSSERLAYTLEPVTRGDIESVVVTTGTLEALNTVIVGSQLSGQIAELHADFNDVVDTDQLVARLDPRTFEARVRQSEADVKVAEASLLQREAEVARAEATLAQAARELERREGLKGKGHISESELDADLTAVETAQAQLEMAEAAVANSAAVVEQRMAALSQSQLDLERTYIRSPVSGTVINRTVEIGQTVAASMQAPELFQIAQDLHQMKVEASVDEADIGRIKEGMRCRFAVDAYPDRRFRGLVQQIRKAPDKVQNVVTYRVIITADNDDLALLPGMTANVEIVLGSKQDVLQVANAALRFTPRGATATAARSAGGGSGPGGSPGRPGGLTDMLSRSIDLSAAQREQIEAISSGMREQMQRASGDREAMRTVFQQARQRTNARIREVLTAEQQVQFDQLLSERETRRPAWRPATIWVLENDEPTSRSVRIGLADEQHTELVSGLEEGDAVIVRAIRTEA